MNSFDQISDNAAGFSRSLMDMADYVEGSIEKVIRKACIDLYRRIVERTPVDTGRAKVNWALSAYESDYVIGDGEYSSTDIASMINSNVSEFTAELIEDQVIIYNNLEYIEPLENGTSDQAPAGMVSLSLVEFEAFFNEQLQGLEGLEPA